jgi:hypothetical protein
MEVDSSLPECPSKTGNGLTFDGVPTVSVEAKPATVLANEYTEDEIWVRYGDLRSAILHLPGCGHCEANSRAILDLGERLMILVYFWHSAIDSIIA